MFMSTEFVEPTRRDLGSKFKFSCYKGIACFTQCCRRADIILTPFDVLKLKKELGIPSDEFLAKYTRLYVDEKSGQPYAVLKMTEEDGKCPFVTEEGCSVYESRPLNCRYYPVGKGLMVAASDRGPVKEEFYFFIKDPNCLGYKEDKEWTIGQWRVNQGADEYDEMNYEWNDIQLRRRGASGPPLDQDKQQLVFMASYDVDKFRSFIFESRFLELFEVDEQELEKMKDDDIAMMRFGFKYLKYILMIEETLKMRVGAEKSG